MEEPPVYLFSHRCDPDVALAKILEFVDEKDVAYGENGAWLVEALWSAPADEGPFRIRIEHTPALYAGPQWPGQRQELIDFFKSCSGADQRPDLFTYLPKLAFALVFTFSPAIQGADDPRLDILMQLAERLDAVIYDTGTLRDPHGSMLLANDREPDPGSRVPNASDPSPVARFQYTPPTAREITDRLFLVLLLAQRGWLELDPAMQDPQGDFEFLLELANRESIVAAALPGELEAFRQPLGKLSENEAWRFLWLCEGSAVLAWALGLVELPPYDERVPITFLLENVPYYPENPDWTLCDSTEVNDVTIQTSFLLLRLKNFEEDGKPADLMAAAEAVGIEDPYTALPLVRINQYDLEIGQVPISQATEDARRETKGILVQRQEALSWLLGIRPSYSWACIKDRDDL